MLAKHLQLLVRLFTQTTDSRGVQQATGSPLGWVCRTSHPSGRTMPLIPASQETLFSVGLGDNSRDWVDCMLKGMQDLSSSSSITILGPVTSPGARLGYPRQHGARQHTSKNFWGEIQKPNCMNTSIRGWQIPLWGATPPRALGASAVPKPWRYRQRAVRGARPGPRWHPPGRSHSRAAPGAGGQRGNL